jgi:hypothetical protein
VGSLKSGCGRKESLVRVQVGRVPVRIVGWESFENRTPFSFRNRGEPLFFFSKMNTEIRSSKKPFSNAGCSCARAVPRAVVSAGVTSAAICRVPASVNVHPC